MDLQTEYTMYFYNKRLEEKDEKEREMLARDSSYLLDDVLGWVMTHLPRKRGKAI